MMPDPIRSALRDDLGATAIEYGLIAGVIAMVIIAALTLLGGEVQTLFLSAANAL